MKIFSNTAGGYIGQLKWGVLALFGVGFLRFLMAPIGVPLSVGGLATSTTVALLITVVAYGVFYGRRRGKIGDVLVSGLAFAGAYLAVIAFYLVLSSALGIDTYFTDERHFRGTVGGHVLAHLQVTPIVTVTGSVVGALAFGIARLFGRSAKPVESSSGA